MFTIRDVQIEAMNAAQMHSFEKRLKEHVNTYFPQQVPAETGGWEALFAKGIRQTKRYKLKTEYGITVFFNIMLTLGADFDTAGQYAWANDILTDKYAMEEEKLCRLIKAAEKALETA